MWICWWAKPSRQAQLSLRATTEVIEVTGAARWWIWQERRQPEHYANRGRGTADGRTRRGQSGLSGSGVKAPTRTTDKNRYAILSVNGAAAERERNGQRHRQQGQHGGRPVMQLPLEAVQEFQISTQRFSAENGRSEGAAINMITKQGTNAYHGSVLGTSRCGAGHG